MSTKGNFKRAIIYICIFFFLLAVAFVFITFWGKSQAGLIEVSGSAFLFVLFLHILKIVIPQSSSRIITVLSIIIAVMLIYGNYSLQRKKNEDYTFRELLVGDLLTKKLIGKHKEIPDELLTKKLKHIIPGEFTQTRTEKHTIESPFEKPEKDLMGKPVALQLDEPVSISIRKEKAYSFGIPIYLAKYKLEFASPEGIRLDRDSIAVKFAEDGLDKFNETAGQYLPAPFYLPSELSMRPNGSFRAIYDNTEISADKLDSEMQQALQEEPLRNEPGRQAEGQLQIP